MDRNVVANYAELNSLGDKFKDGDKLAGRIPENRVHKMF
jgi:hypothetical protein